MGGPQVWLKAAWATKKKKKKKDKKKKKKTKSGAGDSPVILATWESEIRRISV
jgi:hypothetical protein